MKSNSTAKYIILLCLCLITVFTFTACKDKTIYAETSDFESYPDYWNDFNEEDIYVPNEPNGGTTSDGVTETPDFSTDDGDDSSDKVDTDGDGIPNKNDDDIDGDNIKNEDDNDIDGDGVDNDNDGDIDGDGTTNDGDLTPEGPSSDNTDGSYESPFVPLN